MLSRYMFQRIRELVQEGKNNTEIARVLGVDRKTVRKYRSSNAPPKYTKRSAPTRVDPLAEFAERARFLFHEHDLDGSAVYVQLREEGYTGSERTVQRRVASWRREQPLERYFEQRYDPGEQAQFDFKEKITLPFYDGDRIVYLFFGTLPYSDFFCIRGFPSLCYEAFAEGMHTFFEAAGGLTRNIRIDNLSPCVSKVYRGMKRDYTSAFVRAIDYYGFKVLPCNRGRGNEKGDVEREIRTRMNHIRNRQRVSGRKFRDFDDLNTWLQKFCECHQNGTKGDYLDRERASLLPLPARSEEVVSTIERVSISSFGTARSERLKASYSVPDNFIGSSCTLTITPFQVTIRRAGNGGDLAAVHQRRESGKHSILLEHALPSLIRKPQAMVRWRHRDILFPSPVFRRYLARLRSDNPDQAEIEFLRAINLVQFVSLDEIGVAMDLAMTSEATELFSEVKQLLLGGGHKPNEKQCDQRPIQTDLTIYDHFIPSRKDDKAS